jgi:hypothetical protein
MSKLVVLALGNPRSGKSTTWNELFERRVNTGTRPRPLKIQDVAIPTFVVSGSPQERRLLIEEIMKTNDARLVLCSLQYGDEARRTLDYFNDRGFAIYVHWLNPGYSDPHPQPDAEGLMTYLLHLGAVVARRDGKVDPADRVREMREFIAGWASTRRF